MRALVTGGSGGLGVAICRALADAGYAVAVGYHTNRTLAERLASELDRPERRCLAIGFDVADAAAAEKAVAHAAAAMGGLDVLVHAAAQKADGLAADLEPGDVARVLAVNVAGAFHCVRAALPHLLASGAGRIIHFSSVLAARANTGAAAYAATKGGIESLTRTLAVELGPKGVTVNAVAPGYVDAGLGRAPVKAAGEHIRSLVPLRRAGTPEEIARVVLFLASPHASYVNGVVIPVDGGLLAGGRLPATRPVASALEEVARP